MVFLALFIFLLAAGLLLTRLKLSLRTSVKLDGEGFHMEIRVMFYRLFTLYRWSLREGGLSFLLKKKKDVPDEYKKEKGRLSAILEMQLSGDALRRFGKDMEVFDLSARGYIATKDAALTALIYGNFWCLLGAVMPYIPQKRLKLDFYPDFRKESSNFEVSCILRVRIIHIIYLILEHKRKNIRKGSSENYGAASY